MKRLITPLLLLAFTLQLSAVRIIEYDGIQYHFEDGEGIATLYHINPTLDSIRDTIVIPAEIMYHNQAFKVTIVGDHAFYMSRVKNVVLPSTIDSIGSYAFYRCSTLLSIEIPENIRVIADHAFDGCYRITRVRFPESLRVIEDNAFFRCTELDSIVIPDACERIGRLAFNECNGIHTLVLGASLRELGDRAFANVQQLHSLTIRALTPPVHVGPIDHYFISRPLFVPASAIAAYRQHPVWGQMKISAIPK